MPTYKILPKNPDPERYIPITTKEGKYYRLKRGLARPATLNHALEKNVSLMSVCSPVAKRIMAKLAPYTQHLKVGRTQVRLTALLMKSFKHTGQMKISVMNDMDLQPDHPFDRLSSCSYNRKHNGQEISLDIKPFPGSVKS